MDINKNGILKSRENRMAAVYLVLSSFLLLMLASRSSFLYPFNDWNDANSYFSVGKALFNGKMPYRDVFDQKGMYLYFFYGLAYLVSHTTFAGVFLMEIILGAFDLFGIYRVLKLYVGQNTALALTPPVLAVIFASPSFYWGGSAEEVCLPFLIWGLYLSLDYFKNKYPRESVSVRTLLTGGLLAGMVANIKFTVLGFFFAWMMCMAFSFLVRREIRAAIKGCLIFLVGMALPFIPWLIYFGIRGGLEYWYWGYVYINVFVYSNLNGEGPGLFERIYILSKILYWVARKNLVYFVFVVPGVACLLLRRKAKWLERFNILALCFFLFFGIYVGGSELPYYALPLSVFAVLGFALLGGIWELFWTSYKGAPQKSWLPGLGCGLSLAAGLGILWICSMNISFMSQKKEELFLYKFKEIVEETPDPTLLNIGCLDAGLYTVCDIVPTCQWFQTQTLPIDDVLLSQEQYIREGRISYVIARDDYPEVIWEQYELVGEEKWYLEENEFTYYLFRRKDI